MVSPRCSNLGPLNVIKKPLLGKIKGTVIEKLLRDHDVLRDGMNFKNDFYENGKKRLRTFA